MVEKRINPETGRTEYKNQPEGLPAIWTTLGFCERCKPFGECVGLDGLSDMEWQAALDLVKAANTTGEAKQEIKKAFYTRPCA
jgi:hypothetical protein